MVRLAGKKDEPPYILKEMSLLEGASFRIFKVGKNLLASEEGCAPFAWNRKWLEPITQKQHDEIVLMKPVMEIVKKYMDNRDRSIDQISERVREYGQQFISENARLSLELGKRLKSDSEIINHKKSQIVDGISRLRKNSLVKSVDIVGNSFSVTTSKLSLSCTDVEIPLEFTDLPAYKIRVDFNNPNIIVERINNSNFQSLDQHPHVNSSGKPCFGNMASHYASAMSDMNIEKTVMVVLGILTSFNSAGPYVSLEDFRKDAKECKKCGKKNVFSTCRFCGNKNFKGKTLKPL